MLIGAVAGNAPAILPDIPEGLPVSPYLAQPTVRMGRSIRRLMDRDGDRLTAGPGALNLGGQQRRGCRTDALHERVVRA